jgi:hypothetical protein
MPPAEPATIGVPFHSVSETTSPKPSRTDFCTQTSESLWKAFTSTLPTPVRFVKMSMSGSSVDASFISR